MLNVLPHKNFIRLPQQETRNLVEVAILLFSFLIGNPLASQSIQDTMFQEKQLYSFARYLMGARMYESASEEYQRLNFLYPNNVQYHKEWIQALRKSGNFYTLSHNFKITPTTDPIIKLEYILASINDNQLPLASLVLEESNLLKNENYGIQAKKIQYSIDLLQGNYSNTISIDPSLEQLRLEYINMHRKSPLLAGTMSAIVPGMGRIYAKDARNAIFSILVIATTGIQSYNRFTTKGIKSPGAWIYGGLSLGFYVANIYGSVNSAKRFNSRKSKLIDDKVKIYTNNLNF